MTKTSPSDLVGVLVADLRPVRPVRMLRTVAVVLAVQAAVVAATAWILGVQMVALERLADPSFLALLAALAIGAGAGAVAMTALSIPGRSVPVAWRMFVLSLPLLLAVVVAGLSPWGGTWKGFAAVLIEGFGCTRSTLLVATPAWVAGLLLLRRLGPLDATSVGLFAGSSALLSAALVVQMTCPSCDAWHLAVAHYLPILVAAWIAALLSPLLLRPKRA
jgi:hypothetical protein